MRITYLDEAGTANKDHEPYLVVAGVIVDPDLTYAEIDRTLRRLGKKYFPDLNEEPLVSARTWGKPLVFHAKDIWHGSGLYPRDQWPLQKRLALLEELSQIPKKFNLTVVWGAIDRKEHALAAAQRKLSKKRAESEAHAMAFMRAMRRVDSWMVERAHREYTIAYAEDRKDVREYIELVHGIYTDRSFDDAPDEAFISSHIIEAVSFVKKERSAVLQIADHCAFIIKRKLQKCPKIEPYFNNLSPTIWEKSSQGTGLYTRAALSELAPVDDVEATAPHKPKRRRRDGEG